MAVLQGGGQNLPSPCVCYPKDPMWNRVKAAKKLKNGKAVGSDSISNEMIKCLVHTKFVDIIRDLFNAIYKDSHFPNLLHNSQFQK